MIKSEESKPAQNNGSVRILVIEDDDDIRLLVKMTLKRGVYVLIEEALKSCPADPAK